MSVVSPQASSRYLLFRILLERFIEDLLEGRPPDEFRPASIETLADEIQKRADGAVDDITNLRRNLNRFQDDISSVLFRATDGETAQLLPLNEGPLVEALFVLRTRI